MQGALRSGDLVNLDAYRRTRRGGTGAPTMTNATASRVLQAPAIPPVAPMWVYWVPVWIW